MKSRDLKQLIGKPEYCAAFDELLDIPGLWPVLKLGALHRVLTVKCDDVIYRFMDVFFLIHKEIVRYLMWIHRAWVELLDGNTTLMNAVDRQTAEAVELRVQGPPPRDSSVVSELLGGGDGKGDWKIFVRCPAEFKGKLRTNILGAQDRIPTLRTFFEDLKYLGPLASSMKLLIDPPAKQTSIHTIFLGISYGNESEFGRSYRALWLFCMQNFPQLVSSPPRKEPKCPKPTVFELNQRARRICTAR